MLRLIFPLLFLLGSSQAWARGGLVFEPYVGLGKTQVQIGSQLDVGDGFHLGAKLGANISKKIVLAADYHTGGPYTFRTFLKDQDWSFRLLGLGVSVDYKIINFWAGFYPESTIDLAGESSVQFEANVIKVGFGMKVSRQLRTNLDLIFYEVESEGFSGVEVESVHVSISVPLEF